MSAEPYRTCTLIFQPILKTISLAMTKARKEYHRISSRNK